MGYITQEDLLRADGNLVWNMAINRETNELDEDKIRQAISDAEAEIDSFLSRRYQLP
ncbi:phage protein Gp36 family protein, partial [Escherichia coli]